jgi:hypothetical protein
MTQKWNIEDNVDVQDNGLFYLKDDAIETVEVTDVPRAKSDNPYAERGMGYLVVLKGERVKRRVYAHQIGNVAVVYLKTLLGTVYCERALELAIERVDD